MPLAVVDRGPARGPVVIRDPAKLRFGRGTRRPFGHVFRTHKCAERTRARYQHTLRP